MAGYIGPNNRRYEKPRRWYHFGALVRWLQARLRAYGAWCVFAVARKSYVGR